MRVLVILENYYPRIGGVETFFKSLIETLDEDGHQITVLTNRYDRALPALERTGKDITIVRKRYYNRYFFTFGAWWAALKHARSSDLIHTTSYNAAVPAWIAAKLTNTKSIITFHERWGDLWYRLPWMSYPAKVLHKLFEMWITRLGFNQFVAVSDFTKESLIAGGISRQRVVRIYNGIQYGSHFPEHHGSKKEDPFTFMFYGRVGYAKGVDLLIEAYKELSKKRKGHRLILVVPSEETPLLQKIRKYIDSHKMDQYVQMLHDLSYRNLLKQISKANAVVIPSYSEGFCFAAVETMTIGTPIISSGQGALAEVVSGRHIVMRSHDVNSLIEAMSNALDGRWAETPKKEFPLEDTIQSYLQLYARLVPGL